MSRGGAHHLSRLLWPDEACRYGASASDPLADDIVYYRVGCERETKQLSQPVTLGLRSNIEP